ncbi:reverse transcriptase/maturase family protein [Oscillochloris sp. ZM17-4]|uniref:reverse transcriptase domain-containing protein n=1 Tax=Oscillochloris sp. ZM17-4 TaxID=2866714 RepID=UPI001C733132|nr:reverse transcriptase domain-containing protein [Oscillochloris sp. ZM17-4]MBX0331501.1 reverse transcriptase/maturase family protein [Oscillochloris sp. ZM17-4]
MRLFSPYDGPPLIAQICQVENMTRAYRQVRANIAAYRRARGSGPDGVTLRDFDASWPQQMASLAEELIGGTYQPIPPRTVRIPKKSGGERAIAIMTIRDRIAQRATLQVLEPLFDPLLHDASFGCRPRLSVADAVARVARYAQQGYTWVVDADIADYFPAIDQRLLLALVRQRVPDVAVLRLIAAWLASGAHADAAPLAWEQSGPPSLLDRGAQALRQLVDGATGATPSALPPALGDPYGAGAWEQPGADGWASPYAGPPALGGFGGGAGRSPLNNLWTAAMLARPALDGVRRAWPSIRRIGGRRVAIAGAVAAGALAAYELAARWPQDRPRGAAQGGPLSPLLANVYLHPFDVALSSQGLRLVRFMDDFVIMCASRDEAERTLSLVERQLSVLRLRLNTEKTSIRDYAEGIDFLGQSLVPRRRGPTIEQGLASFSEADAALRAAMRQAGQGARRAGQSLGRRRGAPQTKQQTKSKTKPKKGD